MGICFCGFIPVFLLETGTGTSKLVPIVKFIIQEYRFWISAAESKDFFKDLRIYGSHRFSVMSWPVSRVFAISVIKDPGFLLGIAFPVLQIVNHQECYVSLIAPQ